MGSNQRQEELIKYSEKIAQLEDSVIKIGREYDAKLTEKEREVEQWALRCQAEQRERRRVVQETSRFDRFEVNSRQQLPERQETLLWVDKLIEFMSRVSSVIQT